MSPTGLDPLELLIGFSFTSYGSLPSFSEQLRSPCVTDHSGVCLSLKALNCDHSCNFTPI